MSAWVSVAKWVGKRDPVALDPASMQFTARPAPEVRTCAGCLFDGQYARVCRLAGEVAQRAGLADCEAGRVVYVLRAVDARQLSIFEVEQQQENAS